MLSHALSSVPAGAKPIKKVRTTGTMPARAAKYQYLMKVEKSNKEMITAQIMPKIRATNCV